MECPCNDCDKEHKCMLLGCFKETEYQRWLRQIRAESRDGGRRRDV